MLAAMGAGMGLAATPADRIYQRQWSRQADRDAGRLVERGSIEPVRQAPTQQDVERRISQSVRHQLQEQTRTLLRDARQRERREQIRRRVNDVLKVRQQELRQRREQREQRQQNQDGEKDAQNEAAWRSTDRRPTADPVSVTAERRIPLATTASPTPTPAGTATIQDRILREIDTTQRLTDQLQRNDVVTAAPVITSDRVSDADRVTVRKASEIRTPIRPSVDAPAPTPTPAPQDQPTIRTDRPTSGTSDSRTRTPASKR